MAVGRISGPLLKSNLIRNGIDLAFETDLLYLDVNNQRVGIKTTNPTHELHVSGTTRTTDLTVDNRADLADVTIQGNTISTTQPYLNLATLDTVVALNKIRIDSVDIEGNAITTNNSNANLELRPNGTGTVNVHSDLNVDGNIHATGNIVADGNITIGDANTDAVVFNAEIASDIIPDVTNTYTLGSDPELGGAEWNDVWVNNLVASSINAADLAVDGIDLALRHGNIYFVAENGDDAHSGDHYLDPFATIKHALSVAVAGDVIKVSPGEYLEDFPLTIPAGVTLKGEGIRGVTIRPTTNTRYNDAVLLNGETTVEDLTITGFYSGGNIYEVTNSSAGSTTVNVGISAVAHTYVSGGSITINGSDYAVTNAVYTHTTGVLVISHTGPAATIGTTIFLKDLTFNHTDGNKVFPDNGYAFRFARDLVTSTRSPYIRNVTVITQGSVTSALDPRGFDTGDAGKGVYIDASNALPSSKQASLLAHSCTFITPGVDAVTITNGARIEWLNCFTYFANRGFYCYDSNVGRYRQGTTKLTLGGVTGTFTQGNTLTITSTDGSSVITATIASVNGNDLELQGRVGELFGFDTTPQSITDGTATATSIVDYDLREFGAEVRMIGSANVYGNYGIYGEGAGVLVYAIGHNLAYIGLGKEETNDEEAVIQANEVVQLDGARIRYNTVDHKGDYRVGDLFYINQETGTVNFTVADFTIDTENGVTFTTGGNTTFVDGNKIETGDWRISGNTVETLTQDANIEAGSGEINLNSNVNITGSLDVTGNVTIGGNITIGDEATDTIEIIAGIDSDITPKVGSTYSLGENTKTWANLFANQVNLDSIVIRDNYIETVESNADLELRANGTGRIYIPTNNVQVDQNLTVSGITDLQNTNVTGTITHVGNYNQTGDTTVTGNVTVTQDLDVSGAVQFEEILVDDNYITTTTSNADLELRANGTGEILIPNNDVQIVNDLTVDNNINANNLTTIGLITANSFTTGDVLIDDNYITTTLSNSDLELRANGTGRIYVPFNDVELDQDLTVIGTTTLANTEIIGTVTHTGNVVQTGNVNLTGDLGITGSFVLSSTAQLENIRIEDNFITTTASNSDLELRATQFGDILVPTNDVIIQNNLNVVGTITVGDVTSLGTITSNRFSTGDILIDDNVITTTQTNSDLELRAAGTGEVIVPSNNVVINNDLTVNGLTTLGNTVINGDITHTGNVTQVGDINLTGNLDVTGEVIISASVIKFEEIELSGNSITTTTSNADLELRANGTGDIFIPTNDVIIENDLSVNGTINVSNIANANLITTNTLSTGDILIDDNYITTTLSNSDLELRANGTGSIIIDTFDINGSTITTSSDFNITPGSQNVNINATGALKLPVGTTLERPTATAGQIRFNTDLARFEGYNGTNWVNLKGVEDLDGDTKVTAELTEGANDNIIRFDVAGSTIATIDSTKLEAPLVNIDSVRIDNNTISTTTLNTDLQISSNGTGSVLFDNFAFRNNTITNVQADAITLFENTANGYVKFDGVTGIVLPTGTSGERPPLAYVEVGQTRFNTDDSRVEVWDGQNWVSVAGAASGITRADAEFLALEIVLTLG